MPAGCAAPVERQQGRVEIGHAHPPLTGRTATSSVGDTADDRSASSPFTQTLQVVSTDAKAAPYRSIGRSSTSPTVSPSSTSEPVPRPPGPTRTTGALPSAASYPTGRESAGYRAGRWLLRPSRPDCSRCATDGANGTPPAAGRATPTSRRPHRRATGGGRHRGAGLVRRHLVERSGRRAHRTAQIIAELLGVGPVYTDERLREKDVGPWEGLTNAEVERGWPGMLSTRERPPGFETDDAAGDRFCAALADLAAAHPGGELLIVSHGGVVRAAQRHLGADPPHLPNLSGCWFEHRSWPDGRRGNVPWPARPCTCWWTTATGRWCCELGRGRRDERGTVRRRGAAVDAPPPPRRRRAAGRHAAGDDPVLDESHRRKGAGARDVVPVQPPAVDRTDRPLPAAATLACRYQLDRLAGISWATDMTTPLGSCTPATRTRAHLRPAGGVSRPGCSTT
ncbi:MAG: histidine phosphatase family protein [Ilumatobacteraceae bacterium]